MINHLEENNDNIDPSEIEEIEKSLFSDSGKVENIGLLNKGAKPKKQRTPEPAEESIGLKPVKEEKEESPAYEEPEEPLFCDIDDKPDEELTHRQLTFSFNKTTAERLIVGTLILLFLFFFFYNPFHDNFPWNQPGYGQATAMLDTEDEVEEEPELLEDDDSYVEKVADPVETTAEETSEEPAVDEEEEEEEETPEVIGEEVKEEETEPQPTTTPETIAAGTVSLEVEDVETKKTSYGGKVTLISFKITNKKRNFVPKIKAYVYDEETRGERMYSPNIQAYEELRVGKLMRANIETQNALFNDLTTEKTVLLRLYDEGDDPSSDEDVLLTTAQKTIMIK